MNENKIIKNEMKKKYLSEKINESIKIKERPYNELLEFNRAQNEIDKEIRIMPDIDIEKLFWLDDYDINNLKTFLFEMIGKLELPRCRDKGHWKNAGYMDLFHMLECETQELSYALCKPKHFKEDLEEVKKEAIDVANQAFFIWDNARRKIEELEK
jgi:hypothetical protein